MVQNLIRAPRQSRSQETMNRILDACETLLQGKPFEAITLADIARASQTGSSSIYARFQDKRAILLAVHERVRDRAVSKFETLCAPERWGNATVEDAMREIIAAMLSWYRDNHNVMKAALLLNDAVIYERISNTIHAGSVQLSYFIQDRVPGQSRLSAVRAADFIFRIMTATFQQLAIFDTISPTKDELGDEEIIDGLSVAALAQITERPSPSGSG